MVEGTGAPDGAGGSVCGHARRIVEDLFGRGEWRCQLDAGHVGSHGATLGSDSCRWDDDGDAPLGAVSVPDESRRGCRPRVSPATDCRRELRSAWGMLAMMQRSRLLSIDETAVTFELARRLLDVASLELAVLVGEAIVVEDPETGRRLFDAAGIE
jgi:hypothetical protein